MYQKNKTRDPNSRVLISRVFFSCDKESVLLFYCDHLHKMNALEHSIKGIKNVYHIPCLLKILIYVYIYIHMHIYKLHNFIQLRLKSGFAQVQILLTACWIFALLKISDNSFD